METRIPPPFHSMNVVELTVCSGHERVQVKRLPRGSWLATWIIRNGANALALIFQNGTGGWRETLVLTFLSQDRIPALAPGGPSRGPHCMKGH